jgi:hypothetical protein
LVAVLRDADGAAFYNASTVELTWQSQNESLAWFDERRALHTGDDEGDTIVTVSAARYKPSTLRAPALAPLSRAYTLHLVRNLHVCKFTHRRVV